MENRLHEKTSLWFTPEFPKVAGQGTVDRYVN